MIEIDWQSFLKVFGAALTGAVLVVSFYSLGLRMLVRAGRVPQVTSPEFVDAIMSVSDKDIKRAEKAAAKAAKRPPLTRSQQIIAVIVAYASFALCAAAVLCGIVIIITGH